jgi:hypothetical protein
MERGVCTWPREHIGQFLGPRKGSGQSTPSDDLMLEEILRKRIGRDLDKAAKATLGAGFQLERDLSAPLSEDLDKVVPELRDVYENPIETRNRPRALSQNHRRLFERRDTIHAAYSPCLT